MSGRLMDGLSDLDRAAYEGLPRSALGKRSGFKPAVWRVETFAGPVVVKDARHVKLPGRWIARWLVGRERAVLSRIATIVGVPQLVARIDQDAFVLTFLPGSPLDAPTFRARPREICEQLAAITDGIHRCGVFHLDLHQRTNLLVDDDGRLHVVDFNAAIVVGPLTRHLAGRILGCLDRYAPYKYLARFAPEELTYSEARWVARRQAIRRLWPFWRPSKRELQAARMRAAALRDAPDLPAPSTTCRPS
jgi:hypothetical protein